MLSIVCLLFRREQSDIEAGLWTKMRAIIAGANQLEADIRSMAILSKQQHTGSDDADAFAAELSSKFKGILEDLQAMFPSPDAAPSHEERKKIIDLALDRAGEELVALAVKFGASEEKAETLKSNFEKLKQYLRDFFVAIGT